jgi:hypothetical protein
MSNAKALAPSRKTKEFIVCYSLRERTDRRNVVQESLPPKPSFVGPRTAGALAAALIALIAVAALLWPSGTPARSSSQPARDATPAIEQTVAGVDDGVPSRTDITRVGRTVGERHCSHDL